MSECNCWPPCEGECECPPIKTSSAVSEVHRLQARVKELDAENLSLSQGHMVMEYKVTEMEQDLAKCMSDLQAVSDAIGTTKYMDPPDGGSPSLAEQVSRMKADLAKCREENLQLREFLTDTWEAWKKAWAVWKSEKRFGIKAKAEEKEA